MFLFIAGLLLVIAAVVAVVISFRIKHSEVPQYEGYGADEKMARLEAKRHYDARLARGAAAVAAVLGLVALALSLTTQVPAQNVGVVTSFSKPTGQDLGPGLHLKAPWHKVTDMDGTIQQLNNLGAGPAEGDDPNRNRGRTTVRLNNNSLMFVENALRWKIKPDAAPVLFADWRKGGGDVVAERIGPGLVEVQLAAAINTALAGYDPLTPGAAGQTTEDVAADVEAQLVSQLGQQIEVVSFTVLRVDFDDATQARIVNVQEEVARTKAAAQRVQTATQDKLANEKLAASVKEPGINQARCVDVLARAVEKGQSLSGAPSCFGGSQFVSEARR